MITRRRIQAAAHAARSRCRGDNHTMAAAGRARNGRIITAVNAYRFTGGSCAELVLIGGTGFTRIVDAGLGAGPVEYLDMVLHSFPAPGDPATAFTGQPPHARPLPQAHENEIARRAEAGIDETTARCGMLDIAGVTVGAAFVGACASTLVIADILRLLHGGDDYSVISPDLRNPAGIRAVPNSAPGEYPAPAYTFAP